MSSLATTFAVNAASSVSYIAKPDKHLIKWAEEHGYPTVNDTVIVQKGDSYIGVSLHAGGYEAGYHVTLAIMPDKWEKSTMKALMKEFKKTGRVFFVKSESDRIRVVINSGVFGKAKLPEKLDAAVDFLSTRPAEFGLVPRRACSMCGIEQCDTYVVEDGMCTPAHTACKENQVRQLLSEVEENETQGNYGLATVCALLGGIVGMIPSLVLVLVSDYIFALLYALIPICAAWGYKKARGKKNGFMMLIVTVISVICSILLVFVTAYMEFVMAGFVLPIFSFVVFSLYDPDMLPGIIMMSLQSLLFCAIGIAIAWGSIRSGNKAKRQRAEQLAAATHVSALPSQPETAPVQAAESVQETAAE